ncbi:MAG: DUF711 family protein [Candidatus Korarchaeota archaeon]|nr:DUF711 family protein [Candidatus Korarchaeota archaeon]
MRIRALAFHAPPVDPEKIDTISDLILAKSEPAFSASGDLAWTKRIVLPRGPWARSPDLVAEVYDRATEAGAEYLSIPLSLDQAGGAPALLSVSDAIFVGIEVRRPRPEFATKLARLLHSVFEDHGPEALTRIAFGLGGLVETPYFPSTASEREGISLSLLYAGDLRVAAQTGSWRQLKQRIIEIVNWATEAGRRIAMSSGIEFLGVDPSVSPWMEESVAALIESLTEEEFGGPGTYWAIWRLNAILSSLRDYAPTVGFSEVMLPVAEDDRLKELASRGKLRLRDLVGLSTVCVAGVDMVALPLFNPPTLAKLMMDALAAAAIKGRPLGLRLILADARPGDWVDLGRFGSVPVMTP